MSNLSSNEFENVLDLGASRAIKKRTGVSMPIRLSEPDKPSMTAHENQAMKVGNPKQNLLDKLGEKIGKGLGLYE
jgi:hypothetical protein